MTNSKGIITRKEIFSDDAMKLGPDFAAQLMIADKAVVEVVGHLKEMNAIANAFKGTTSQKEYVTLKQQEALATQQAIDAIKKQEAAELSALKIKKESIATAEAERKAKQAATDAESKSQKAKEGSIKLTLEERVQNELNNRVQKQAILAKLNLTEAYTKLSNERTKAKNILRDLIASETASTAEIKKAQKEYDVLDAKVRKADKAVGDFTKNVGNYNLAGIKNSLKDLAGSFGIVGGAAAFASVLKGAIETIKEFDQSIADLSAITGASGKDLDFLKKSAIELGKETKGGAVKVVEAYKLIASAKPELLENVKDLDAVTESVLTLSKASGMELPEAATALTDAMNQFGAPAEKASEFVDALANGAKFGAAEIPQVTDALLKFGAVARSSNISIQESTALIELLAENGIKGADAGTALRNVLLKISAPDALPKEAQQALNDLGISFELLKDKSVPIQEKFEALKPLLADNGKLLKTFGFENTVAAQNIIEHTDRLSELTDKMYEFGTAEEQAEIRTNTLQGKTDILASTYDSFILSLNEGSGVVSSFFKFFVVGATDALNSLIRLNTSWDELFDKAKTEGTKSGVDTFKKRFNSLLGTGDETEISKSIKEVAKRDLDLYQKQYIENQKKIAALNKRAGFKVGFGAEFRELSEEKERLEKRIAEEASIIKEANTKIVNANKKAVKANLLISDTPTTQVDDKKAKEAEKRRLEREKQLSDSLYELEKQRLEQSIQLNNELANEEEQSDEIRIQALKNSQKKQEDLLLLTKNHLLDNDKLTANDRIRINEEYSFKLIEASKKTQEEIDKITQFDEAEYQKQLELKLSINNEALNKELAEENIRFKALGDLDKLSKKEKEKATEEHEQKVFDIKKKYAIEGLKLQIANLQAELDANDALPVNDQVSAEKRQRIAEALSKAKLDLTEVEVKKNDEGNKKKEFSDAETAEAILGISQNLTNALDDLATSLYERKISNIDEELAKNDEYYSRQIELAGNDEKQKALLQEEADKKRKILEDKKRKEQHKQAVFNKAMSAVQVGISTAQAIMQSYAQLGPIAGSAGAILAGVLGAIQLAAVLAAPIPKYKMGRKGGKAEFAEVGDGYVHEVIEKPDGRAFLTPNKPTLTYLGENDNVYSSVDDYYALQKASMMSSINMQGRKMSDYQTQQEFDKQYGKEILDELKRNTRAIERSKTKPTNQKPIDIPHSIWKSNNVNWS